MVVNPVPKLKTTARSSDMIKKPRSQICVRIDCALIAVLPNPAS